MEANRRQQSVEQLLCLNEILFLSTIASLSKVRLARNCNLTAYTCTMHTEITSSFIEAWLACVCSGFRKRFGSSRRSFMNWQNIQSCKARSSLSQERAKFSLLKRGCMVLLMSFLNLDKETEEKLKTALVNLTS